MTPEGKKVGDTKVRSPLVTELTHSQRATVERVQAGKKRVEVNLVKDEKRLPERKLKKGEKSLKRPQKRQITLKDRFAMRVVSPNLMLPVLSQVSFKPKPPKSIVVSTSNFGIFTLDRKIFSSELEKIEQKVLEEKIAEKIEAGGQLYAAIMRGEKDNDTPSQKEISNLMWFLQVKAENLEENLGKKVNPFSSGSLSLEDPNEFLRKYLDQFQKEVYQRKSSHIKEFQKSQGGVARGIDFNPGSFVSKNKASIEEDVESYLENVLPYGKGTLMYSPMSASSGLIENSRLLLKLENFGCAMPGFKDKIGGPKSREFDIYKDLEHVIGHAWEFLFTLWRTLTGSQNEVGSRKERIPPIFKNEYKAIFEKINGKNKFVAQILAQGNATMMTNLLPSNIEFPDHPKVPDTLLFKIDPLSDSAGIRVMYARAKWLLEEAKKPETKIAITADSFLKLSDFCESLEKKYSMESLGLRIGDEVVLGVNDLKPHTKII